LIKVLARQPVPIILLARLAVDRRWQGRGIGKALSKDAMTRTRQAADSAGIRAFAVHANNEQAKRFYERSISFPPRPTRCTYWFFFKDVRRIVSGR
jgi:ribosomal protein S18 acetylase RimI-like enzyme